jgi:integrase
MPSLLRRADGRYYINYTDSDGTRRKHYVPTRDANEARAYADLWIRTHEAENAAPVQRTPAGPRLIDILNYYRDTYLHAQNAAQATHAAVQTHCTAFLEFCRVERIGRVQQVNAEVLARWSAQLQRDRNARTARNYLTTIRTAFNVAVDAELLNQSPVRRWPLPKVDAVEKHPLNQAELAEVMQIFHDVPIVLWMCLTGQRPSDARTLKFGDVDIPSRTVHRPSVKVRALRKFQIAPAAALLIEQQARRPHGPGDVVFLSRQGRPWSEDGILNSMKARYRQHPDKRAVTPKQLRDAFGTIMANDRGMPLPELQILMGHSDITTTMKYVRARGAEQWLEDWSPNLSPIVPQEEK